VPGKDPGGIIVTIAIGVVGAIVAGFVTSLILGHDYVSGINFTTIIVATLGAILLLIVYRLVKQQRGTTTSSPPGAGP